MADSDLPGLGTATSVDTGDLLHVVDVSDTSGAADGTDKKITAGNLATSITSIGSLATDTEVATAVSNHAAATDPHGDRAYAAALVDDLSGVTDASTARTNLGLGTAATQATSAFEAAGAVASHEADTTNVHGIADTSALLDTGDLGVTVQAYDADTLKADTADQLTAGFTAQDYAAGTKSSGTFTPDAANGNFQTATNGGAHTLAPPSSSCTIIILYTNNGSAGTITTSGFTQVDGDAFDTTDTNKFVCYVTKIGSSSVLTVKALQ